MNSPSPNSTPTSNWTSTSWMPRWFVNVAIGLVCVGGIAWAGIAATASLFKEDKPLGMTHTMRRGDLVVTVAEQGMVESAENFEIKSNVRGWNTVLWIVESGAFVNKGDEIVRLDAFQIQEQIDERTKFANWSKSGADRSSATLAAAKIAVSEYDDGRFPAEVMNFEKQVAVSEASVRAAEARLRHVRAMAATGYLSELEVEEADFAVKQAKRGLEVKRTELEVLRNYTYKEQMQTLEGQLKSITANHKANAERAMADASRRDRAVAELPHCVIKAERSGLVIHPNAAKWETRPVAEGSNVHKDQLLLLMPNLDKMQVKVGVHESLVKRVKTGQSAIVTFSEDDLHGSVTEVASITKPAGWWTGNQVRYDTLVALPSKPWLRPGMSAEVEITIAEYQNELLIPVAAIVDQGKRRFCWVMESSGPVRREIMLGDTNEVHYIVRQGLEEGEQVLLNPYAYEQPVSEDDALDSGKEDSEGTTPDTNKATDPPSNSKIKKPTKPAT